LEEEALPQVKIIGSTVRQFDGDEWVWVAQSLAAREPFRLPACQCKNSLLHRDVWGI